MLGTGRLMKQTFVPSSAGSTLWLAMFTNNGKYKSIIVLSLSVGLFFFSPISL